MTIFNALTLVGGLCLFLLGMNLMGQALERRAGGRLRTLLDKMTSRVMLGFLTGLGVTAIIQSSSATTVMVVGFVNSGLMTLRQAINVIMGANVGTTVTAWFLSLAGIDSGSLWVQLLKPASFTPVLALIGIIFYMFCKDTRKKDTGLILLGFTTLMFGMETMSGAVAGLRDVPAFTNLFLAFTNPLLGVLVGALVTAVIQSSSASVGILQALSVTGGVSYAAAIPIIMGQNIGTCVTALLSSVGTNKNARRAAIVHLLFNVIGVTVLLTAFCIVKAALSPALLDEPTTMYGIAIVHSVFNILCTAMLLPAGGLLERLAMHLVPDGKSADETAELSRAAKAKRVNDHTNPAYKWVALAIVIAGAAAMVYGIITLIRGGGVSAKDAAKLLPSREQFVRVWRALEREVGGTLTSPELPFLRRLSAEALGAESFPRTVMCLAVFAERGLVTVERHDKYITLRLTGGKRVDLDASPYLCALREGLDGTKGGSSV